MRETYTQAEAARSLSVSRRTLYNWMRTAGLEVGTWPAKERSTLSRAEVDLLADAHKRIVQDIDTLRDPLHEIAGLQEQIGRLEVRMLKIESQVQTLIGLLRDRLVFGDKADEQES